MSETENNNQREAESASVQRPGYGAMTVDNIASFSIDSRLVHDNPAEIAEVFRWIKFVATRAECSFSRRQIDYEGISEIFRPVNRDLIPPRVELKVTKDAGGRVINVEAIPSA